MRPLKLLGTLALLLLSVTVRADSKLDSLIAELEPAIHDTMEKGHIPSLTIALVAGDTMIWSKGYGYANLWARTEATPDTVYLIGSTFKAMNMTALLQQMEIGKFTLDQPVREFLDDLTIEGENPEHPITFRHLFAHVSGIPGGFGAHPVWGETVPRPIGEFLASSLKVGRLPETEFEYSNIGFTLVAHLLERITGEDFRRYVRANIWRPLGMTDTAFSPTPPMEERLAIPYTYSNGKQIPATRFKADVWPAGIVYGTVLDQAKWLAATLNDGQYEGGRLLEKNTYDLIMRRQYDQFAGPVSGGNWLNEDTGYGLTWWITVVDGETLFAHSGSVPGYTAWLVGNRDRKLGVAMLTNGHQAHALLNPLSMQALELLGALAGE
jgi:CubicO group peptidase (beta-lactamase class C family)